MDDDATGRLREAEAFLAALFPPAWMKEDERAIFCDVAGDPGDAPMTQWRPKTRRDATHDLPVDLQHNGYVTACSFAKADDGTWRRRKSTCVRAFGFVIDDIGTKIPMDKTIDWPQPCAVVETSPQNFQHWYFFKEPVAGADGIARFDGLISAFIEQKLDGVDPGMAGVTRVGRLPGCVNTKKKYGGAFVVKTVSLNADLRYTIDELLTAFGLKIKGRVYEYQTFVHAGMKERTREFAGFYKFLQRRGMLKKEHPDPSGWTEMTCPWLDRHTGHANTGAAIRDPHEDNSFYGAFRCHHGSCVNEGWMELTEWIAEQANEELEQANDRG